LGEPETGEVIVIDDGSRDDTYQAAIAADDGSGRLRVVRQANKGPSAALNHAHDLSTSPYVCVLDADDFFVPGRLGRIFRDARPGWDMAADRLLLAREGREDGPYEVWGGAIPADGVLDFASFVTGNISDPKRPRTELGYLQPVFRREFIDRYPLRYNEAVRLGEDFLFYAEALARGAKFEVIDACGYVAVSRASSLSHAHTSADLYQFLEADLHLLKTLPLASDERRALTRHALGLRERWIYHFALDAKAQGRLASALPRLLLNADVLGYAITQTFGARFASRAFRAQADLD
jgi:succinoglycan biosynthesis protein ExoU